MRELNGRRNGEEGVALIMALMAVLLLSALGFALVMTTSTESMIASNYRNGAEGLYAADAAVERAMDDLLTVPDWNKLLDGSTQSAFVDTPCLPASTSCTRTLPDGSTLDLKQVINMQNCGKTTACTTADLVGNGTGDRPYGANNPVWQLYAYGPVNDLLPTSTINSPFYVVVLVADDPAENDDNPLQDGVVAYTAPSGNTPPQGNPGTGVLALRTMAFGPRGAQKVIDITVARTDTTELERGYTGQRGQDEQNRRARKAPVQSPGKALTNQSMLTSTGIIQ